MLVKIIAIGLDPAAWKDVFHRLRQELPGRPFSVGMFSTPEELAFLEQEFFPSHWRREAPDFFLCGADGEDGLPGRLPLLEKIAQLPGAEPSQGVLVVDNLEKDFRELVRKEARVGLLVEGGSLFYLSDPAFLLRSFPKDFPRIQVDRHLVGLRLKSGAGPTREVIPEKMAAGTLVGFSEIETVITPEGPAKPREWLKALAAQDGKKTLPKAAGLIREEQGTFLFPGIPLERVRGVELRGARFAHVIERKAPGGGSPQFRAFKEAVEKIGAQRARRWQELTARLRKAEARTDIPLVCGGESALLRESLAALLVRGGYPRCYTLAAPGEDIFREPSLLLQVAPWAKGRMGAQADQPMTLDLIAELERRMKPLERLLPWRELDYEAPPPDLPRLTGEAFSQQRKRLAARGRRVKERLELEEKRGLLLRQENEVLEGALQKLTELLEAGDAIQVWSGTLPEGVKQALIFSHDKEEAGAVLQAIPHIQKKRWFDLSPFGEPDAIRNLNLEGVRHYGEEGVMLITGASRERLEKQRTRTARDQEAAAEALAENSDAQTRLGSENQEVEEAREKLARQFIWQALSHWLAENTARLDKMLDGLREKHERRWFNRAQVRRALLIPYTRENGGPLLEACTRVYPSFSQDLSVVVPYEFDTLDALPEEAEQTVRREAAREKLAPGAVQDRLGRELERHNEALFADFLQVISAELTGTRIDLLVIEHRPEFAGRILEYLRRAVPQLENTPAILVLSELWEPPAEKALPWPRTRVVLLPRMGALAANDCAEQIRSLYSI